MSGIRGCHLQFKHSLYWWRRGERILPPLSIELVNSGGQLYYGQIPHGITIRLFLCDEYMDQIATNDKGGNAIAGLRDMPLTSNTVLFSNIMLDLDMAEGSEGLNIVAFAISLTKNPVTFKPMCMSKQQLQIVPREKIHNSCPLCNKPNSGSWSACLSICLNCLAGYSGTMLKHPGVGSYGISAPGGATAVNGANAEPIIRPMDTEASSSTQNQSSNLQWGSPQPYTQVQSDRTSQSSPTPVNRQVRAQLQSSTYAPEIRPKPPVPIAPAVERAGQQWAESPVQPEPVVQRQVVYLDMSLQPAEKPAVQPEPVVQRQVAYLDVPIQPAEKPAVQPQVQPQVLSQVQPHVQTPVQLLIEPRTQQESHVTVKPGQQVSTSWDATTWPGLTNESERVAGAVSPGTSAHSSIPGSGTSLGHKSVNVGQTGQGLQSSTFQKIAPRPASNRVMLPDGTVVRADAQAKANTTSSGTKADVTGAQTEENGMESQPRVEGELERDVSHNQSTGEPSAATPAPAAETTKTPSAGESSAAIPAPAAETTKTPSAGESSAATPAPAAETTKTPSAGESSAATPPPAAETTKTPSAGESSAATPAPAAETTKTSLEYDSRADGTFARLVGQAKADLSFSETKADVAGAQTEENGTDSQVEGFGLGRDVSHNQSTREPSAATPGPAAESAKTPPERAVAKTKLPEGSLYSHWTLPLCLNTTEFISKTPYSLLMKDTALADLRAVVAEKTSPAPQDA